MARAPRKLEQVVEAAIAEFQEHGFTGANMDRISERAGVSKRTLYNYFASKDALFVEIMQRTKDMFADTAPCQFDPDADTARQIRALALRMARPYCDAEAIKMARLVVGEWMRNQEAVGDLMSQIEFSYPAEAFFASAAEAGRIDEARAPLLSADLVSFIKGRCLWTAVIGGERLSAEDASAVAEDAAVLFSRHLCRDQ